MPSSLPPRALCALRVPREWYAACRAGVVRSRTIVMAAQPVRIWGCFDGLVLIDAKPMHEHGVRFRDPGVNECKESQARGLL